MDTTDHPAARLFVGFAIDIGTEGGEALAAAIKKTRIGAQQREMEINWVSPANFHVTLNFLGSVERTKLPILTELLNQVAAQTPRLATSLRGMGGFPDERHMRTLWVGVRNSRGLQQLQSELREKLVNAGFSQEDRAYSPHLTIGKTRKARNATDLISPFVRTKFGECEIDTILLFESVQHGPHSSYAVLERFALTGSPPSDETV